MARPKKHPATASLALALTYLAAAGVATTDEAGVQLPDEKLFELVEETAAAEAAKGAGDGADAKPAKAEKADPHSVKVKKDGAASFNGVEPNDKGVFTIPVDQLDAALAHGFERIG